MKTVRLKTQHFKGIGRHTCSHVLNGGPVAEGFLCGGADIGVQRLRGRNDARLARARRQ